MVVTFGFGILAVLAAITGRPPPRKRAPGFDEPMVPPPPGPPIEHPVEITAVSYEEARSWLAWAYAAETAFVAPATALAMLLAHSALETAEWAKLRGWNFGNITALKRNRPYYVLRGVTEYVDGKPVVVDMYFRWYPSASLGAWDFVHVLRKTFPPAWALLESRDPDAYANALADAKYYTGSREKYAEGLSRWYTEFERRELGRVNT